MVELQLTRSPDDRHLYALHGVGTLRLGGWFSRSATAEAGAGRWQISRRGMWQAVIEAADASGAVAGEFKGRTLRRGGGLRWSGRELELRSSSVWRERHALVEGERELATIEGKGWGKPSGEGHRRRRHGAGSGIAAVRVFRRAGAGRGLGERDGRHGGSGGRRGQLSLDPTSAAR
ncbi:MAG: hypothetical protein WKF42_02680 [Solirubrobacteraceae bacterium]